MKTLMDKDWPEENPGHKLYREYTENYISLTKNEQAFAKIACSQVYKDYINAQTYGIQIRNQEILNGGKL